MVNKLTVKQQGLLQQVRDSGGTLSRHAITGPRSIAALSTLVRKGFMERVPGTGKMPVYRITERGWGIVRATPKSGGVKS